MSSISNILVIVDPTAQQHPAVDKAALLAERFDARLDLFVCDTKASRNLREAAHLSKSPSTPFQDNLPELLRSIASPLQERGLDVATEVLVADPLHTALLNRVKHTCADLVVKDTHHHSVAQRTFLTHTDWELIRGCPVPLLLVKPTPWSGHRIGAAIDPGHLDDKPKLLDRCILHEAVRLARGLDGEVHIIHAYIPAAMIAAASVHVPPLIVDIPEETLLRERQEKLDEITALTTECLLPAENIHVQTGSVGDVLCRLAREHEIEIMTMGAVSRSGLQRILIGSTAEIVLEQLPCDLLVVKGPNFAELLPW